MVTDDGRVWSAPRARRSKGKHKARVRGRWPKTFDRSGYPSVHLCKDSHVKKKTVHSLVAEAFLGHRPEGLVVDHIDRNKKNSNLSNLRYVTRGFNTLNPESSGVFLKADRRSPKKWVAVIHENNKTKTIGYFQTESEAIAARSKARGYVKARHLKRAVHEIHKFSTCKTVRPVSRCPR